MTGSSRVEDETGEARACGLSLGEHLLDECVAKGSFNEAQKTLALNALEKALHVAISFEENEPGQAKKDAERRAANRRNSSRSIPTEDSLDEALAGKRSC